MKYELNKWINLKEYNDSLEIGKSENYNFKGLIFVGEKPQTDNDVGFYINGRFNYTPTKDSECWLKIVE